MSKIRHNVIFTNLPNIVSILGVLPIGFLLHAQGYQYLIPIIIFNNVMDDLDGILAKELNLKSDFGARLDNVCDAVSHIMLAMVVGMHYGLVTAAASVLASIAILIRVVSRLDPVSPNSGGSPTNELIRHILFVLILSNIFTVNPEPYLIAVFLINIVSLLIPYNMPYMIRSLAKSTATICLVNVALALAWLVPITAPFIAGCFFLSYICSLIAAGLIRERANSQPATSTHAQ